MRAHYEAVYQTRPLRAFCIGPDLVYAAYDVNGAVQLANSEYGYACFSRSDVTRCDTAALVGPAYSAIGIRLGTLWQQLALVQPPGYLCACSP